MVVTVTDIAVACMVLPWLVLVPLLVRTRQRDVRDALEDGRQPLYQEVCGGAFGKTQRSSPFVRVALYDEFLVIGYSRRLILRYQEIESVSVDGARSPRAVRLHHHRRDLPAEVAIWSPDCYGLHERIEAQRRAAIDLVR
jgi:hypothetical protein